MPVFNGASFLGVGSLSLSEDTDSTDDWLDVHEEALFSSTAFFGGGPFDLLLLLRFTFSFVTDSSLSVFVDDVSFSSLDFRDPLLGFGDPLGLLGDLLSDSDSELLSGEKILFFFWSDFVAGLDAVLGAGLVVLAPPDDRGAGLPLARTIAAALGLAEQRLLGGKGFGSTTFGVSSSLDDDILFVFDGRLCFGSSFFLGSSAGGLAGDFGAAAGVAVVACGVSDAEDSESELDEPDPELLDELPLLLESEVEPELLSVLLWLVTYKERTKTLEKKSDITPWVT